MFLPLARTTLLFACTISTFLVLGRAPGAVNLRTRDIETEIAAERRSGRDQRLRLVLPWDERT